MWPQVPTYPPPCVVIQSTNLHFVWIFVKSLLVPILANFTVIPAAKQIQNDSHKMAVSDQFTVCNSFCSLFLFFSFFLLVESATITTLRDDNQLKLREYITTVYRCNALPFCFMCTNFFCTEIFYVFFVFVVVLVKYTIQIELKSKV